VAGAAEHRRTRRPRLVPALLAAALAAATAALVARADADTASPRHAAQFDATVRFLQEDQNDDGGFGGEPGSPSDPDFASWVALALAAADINPHSQAKPGQADVYSYLAAHVGELSSTTDFERALLVVDASESPPQPLGGVDLVERILERRLPSGTFTHEAGGSAPGMNDTIFAVLALSPIKEAATETVVREAAEWVVAEQNGDGSWPAWCPRSVCTSETDSIDMTGAAIEALNAAGMGETGAQEEALEYLHETQLRDGGWPQQRGESESNVGSTAWVVQGIWAAGQNPETWRTGSGEETEEPLDYLTSLQRGNGEVEYMKGHQSLGVWMTAYVAPALAGRALPIVPPPPLSPPTAPNETEAGPGSAAGNGGEGVIAGGGGHGAPLFSRPKAESKGETPGGARVVRGQSLRAKDHSHNRRGANQRQPNGTETAEAAGGGEVDQGVGAVSLAGPDTADTQRSSLERPYQPGDERGGVTGRRAGSGRSAPRPTSGAHHATRTASGEEVSGVVVGSPDGDRGKLAFGAPGLRSAGGGGDGLGTAIAIGAAAFLAALLGFGWERRRGVLA
jgi:hypothetical protein